MIYTNEPDTRRCVTIIEGEIRTSFWRILIMKESAKTFSYLTSFLCVHILYRWRFIQDRTCWVSTNHF
jgi:hypothetical protein